MENENQIKILKQGVEAWNQWRKQNPDIRPDLFEVDFINAQLPGANLEGARISRTNLEHANLTGACLKKSRLINVNLNGANLSEANLCDAHFDTVALNSANLQRTRLIGARLFATKLNNANLSSAYILDAQINSSDFIGADLTNVDLRNTSILFSDFDSAKLLGCKVFGISAWRLNLKNAIQSNLIITEVTEPEITVDNLEIAQFIYLLLNNENIRGVINTITTKVVLILGRFRPKQKAILEAIRNELHKHNLIPVIFDFQKPATKDTHETITTLARLARFVIADITSPKSIPQELVSIVETLPSLPIKPILKSGNKPWGMFDHIKRYPWVLEIFTYHDLNFLLVNLREMVIAPAEAKAKELQSV